MAIVFEEAFTGIAAEQSLTAFSASWALAHFDVAPLGQSDGSIYSGGVNSAARRATAQANADYDVIIDADIVSLGNSGSAAALGRWDATAQSGYRLTLARVGTTTVSLSLSRVTTGTGFTLGTAVTGISASTGTSRRIRLRMVGSTISAYLDDDLVTAAISATNSNFTEAGYAALQVTGASARICPTYFAVDDPAASGGVSTTLTLTTNPVDVSVTGTSGSGSVSTTLAITAESVNVTVSGAVPTGGNVRLQFGLDAERGGVYASVTGIQYWVFGVDRSTVIAHGSTVSTDGTGVGFIDLTGSPYSIGDNVLVALLKETAETSVLDRTLRSGLIYVPAIGIPA